MDRLIAFGGVGLWATGAASMVYGATQLNFSWVTIGALLSTTLPLIQFVSNQMESRTKTKMERVDKLLPNVYNPLSAWAKSSVSYLDNHTPTEIWSDLNSSPPPVELQGVFTLLGIIMRRKVEGVTERYKEFDQIRDKVRLEYHSRIIDALRNMQVPTHWPPDWTPDNVSIWIRKSPNESLADSILRVASNYGPTDKLIESAKTSKVVLKYANQNPEFDCPPDLFEKATRTDDLLSYPEFIKVRTQLRSDLVDLNSEINYAIENGERDW